MGKKTKNIPAKGEVQTNNNNKTIKKPRRVLVKPNYVSRNPPSKSRQNRDKVETLPRSTAMLTKWIENHRFLEQPFIIPREQRAYVQPHLWKFSTDILNQLAAQSDRLIVIMRPSIDRFLTVGVPAGNQTIKAYPDSSAEAVFNRVNAKTFEKGMTFDEVLQTTDGRHLSAGLVSTAPAGYFYNSRGDAKAGCKMYPGSLINWDGKLTFDVHNPDAAEMQFEVIVIRETTQGQFVEEVTAQLGCPPGQSLAGNFNVANPQDYANINHFGFAWRITNSSTLGSIPSGMQFRVSFTSETTVVGTVAWKVFSVWEILTDPNHALRTQYESSNSHCFTAMHATITNAQAELYKGGTVLAAQIAGFSDDKIPSTFEGISSWVSTRQADVQDSKSLTNGSHWCYRWEKVQDTFFISTDDEQHTANSRPSYISAMQAPSLLSNAEEKKFNLLLSGAVMVEYITEVRDSPIFMSPPDTINLLARYCAILGDMPACFENPSHIDQIKKWVKKIVASPTARQIARDIAIGGVTLALA